MHFRSGTVLTTIYSKSVLNLNGPKKIEPERHL